MPNIFIEMIEGRTVEQKQLLAEQITKVTADILQLDPEIITIRFLDNKRENLAKGGKLYLYR
ncbi:4-oxalocrotonate tautomerase [Flavonifractor sp. An92]|uniref:tautomerase family protein n=1 Tax=Flavonifractor sp. An92 TaxID=1965666 RepID=UPI000B37924E|nr:MULTISPECIES: tautomerase family protein [unclassified Flavonifractor]OUN01895.1 4-oxalocrotonate tautomerase [Flavonifractor sp. An92]OUQ22004.1 4-oxalocrotonate tautomerase [Flavonifractor sp. An135]